jgi:hypothetical protein
VDDPLDHLADRPLRGEEPLTRRELAREQAIDVQLTRAHRRHRSAGGRGADHRQFLRDWLARRPEGARLHLEEAWRIREACIAALGAGTYVGPA